MQMKSGKMRICWRGKLIGSVLFGLILLLLYSPELWAENAPAGAIEVAERMLPDFLAHIFEQALRDSNFKLSEFGFAENDAYQSAYLGEPFHLREISIESLGSFQAGIPVVSLLTERPEWYFPVMLGKKPTSNLIVAKMNDAWCVVGFGQGPVAAELAKIRQQWPKENGYDPILIVANDPYRFLFTVPEYDTNNLTPVVPWGNEDYTELQRSAISSNAQ